ncbi:unnamed protein product [Durusdinium trenchii]|uniref:Uncharacterized protein n=1 Tax=Durusdinium trenchii TaxID=1381693 RepID=A0ABP0HSN1_9DINO
MKCCAWAELAEKTMNGSLPKGYIHVWCVSSDNGPDQAAFKTALRAEFVEQQYSNQVLFSLPCLKASNAPAGARAGQMHLQAHRTLPEEMGLLWEPCQSVSLLAGTWPKVDEDMAIVWMEHGHMPLLATFLLSR